MLLIYINSNLINNLSIDMQNSIIEEIGLKDKIVNHLKDKITIKE
jgi:hypothetical protein